MTYRELKLLLDGMSTCELDEKVKLWDPNDSDWYFCSLTAYSNPCSVAHRVLSRGRAVSADGDVILEITWEG